MVNLLIFVVQLRPNAVSIISGTVFRSFVLICGCLVAKAAERELHNPFRED